jgi:putative transposase
VEAILIRQAYRFALDPSVEQEQLLVSFTGAARFWFNQGLALVKERLNARDRGEDVRVPWSYKALCSEFKGDGIKDELAPWRHEVVVGSYQAGLEALGKALQNFTEGRRAGRRVGFPRFRAKGRCRESVIFQRPRIRSARRVEFDRRLGPIRTKERMSRVIRLLERDEQARIMRATVSRSGSNWYVSFTVERSRKERRARRQNAAVGVDVGLARLATLSTGEVFANSRPLQDGLRKLRHLERQLDRQRRANNPGNYLPDGRVKPGALNWVKSKRMLSTEARVRRLHERVANLRREQTHQLTSLLTREFGVIGVETLNIRGMQANRRLARHITDVGWGTVLAQLKYKASWSDGSILELAGLLVVVRVDLDVVLPLVGQLVLGEAGVDRAGFDAGVAVDALLGVDVELDDRVVVGLVGRRVDAVDGTDLHAGVVLRVDAGLGDDVGQWSPSRVQVAPGREERGLYRRPPCRLPLRLGSDSQALTSLG